MTRGIVQICCGVDVVTLYMCSDAYPMGLGRELLDFVNKNPVASLGVNDYAMRLLRCNWGLELDLDWEQKVLEWVYRVLIGEGGLVSLTAQMVSWEAGDKRPQMERLLPPMDLAVMIQKEEEEELAYEKHCQELMASVSPCPHCHVQAAPKWNADGGVHLYCWNTGCRRHLTGPKRKTLEEAVMAWNDFVRVQEETY